jgi:hypothetical protein
VLRLASKLPRPYIYTVGISHNRTSGRFVHALGEGTPEVHGEMDPNKYMLCQSVRLVGAVGIEPTTLALTCRENACGKLPRDPGVGGS